MQRYPYITSYNPAFPAVEIRLYNSETNSYTDTLPALVDTGADGTLIPLSYLREILAPPLTETRIRSHWGEWRTASLFLVNIKIGVETLPNVFAVGDERGDEIVLGRDVLNRFALVLDGPASLTTLR